MAQENILGTQKIGKLLLKFGLPGIISFVVNSIYNIVDQIFIGQSVGFLGNASTSVIFPITTAVVALGLLLGDGAAANMSLNLGMGKKHEASQAAAFGLISTLIAGAALCAVCLIFIEPLCWLFGGTPDNIQYCLDYGTIISIGIPFLTICVAYGSILRADGKPGVAMGGLLMGCGINLILDPVFIFVCGWGVKGAALATILGMIANAILIICFCFARPKFIELNREIFRTCTQAMKSVLRLGIASCFLQLAIVVAIVVQNKVIVRTGVDSIYGPDIPLAAMGITSKVFSIVLAVINGLSSGAQPIYGYNYGARNYDRVKKTFKYILIVNEIVLVAAFLCFQLIPDKIVSIFGSQDALNTEYTIMCMKIFLAGLPFSGLQAASGTFFLSLGYPVQSIITSLSRQILFMIPTLLILTSIMGLIGNLYMGPVADVLAFVLCLILILVYWKKIFPESKPQSGSV